MKWYEVIQFRFPRFSIFGKEEFIQPIREQFHPLTVKYLSKTLSIAIDNWLK